MYLVVIKKQLVYDHIGTKYFDMGQKKVGNPLQVILLFNFTLQDIMKNLFSPQITSKTLTDTDMD